jgi:sporulation protein YlmC with PRC-barrel domain
MKITVSLATLALMAGYAVAQTPPPAQPEQQPSTIEPSTAPEPGSTAAPKATQEMDTKPAESGVWYQRADDDWSASEIIGTQVRNTAGEEIGDVNEIILANDGKVRAVVIGVGGFLGMGERDVAVEFNSLKLSRDSDNDEVITVNATKESLKSAPQWERRRMGN